MLLKLQATVAKTVHYSNQDPLAGSIKAS